jgi:hypothetical protein
MLIPWHPLLELIPMTRRLTRALELYGKALELVSDDGNKARLEDIVRKLKG